MILKTIHSKLVGIPPQMIENTFKNGRKNPTREIDNLCLSFVRIYMPHKRSFSIQNSAPGTILNLFFPAFKMRLFNMFPIYDKKVLNIGRVLINVR